MLIYFNGDIYKKTFAAIFFTLNQEWVWIHIFEEIHSESCIPTTLSFHIISNLQL